MHVGVRPALLTETDLLLFVLSGEGMMATIIANPPRVTIVRPNCSKCGSRMSLARIFPTSPILTSVHLNVRAVSARSRKLFVQERVTSSSIDRKQAARDFFRCRKFLTSSAIAFRRTMAGVVDRSTLRLLQTATKSRCWSLWAGATNESPTRCRSRSRRCSGIIFGSSRSGAFSA